ncbi:Synaptic functional regulator FMR1 [Bienertia sinuspersici]
MMPKDSETPQPSTDFHPAQAVSNIRNEIPIILSREHGNYANWVELFEIHCLSCNVLHHIDPNTPRPSGMSDAMWTRLDSIVKKWMYNTIAPDLVNTVLYRGATALETWNRIKAIFQNNKHTRAIFLENQFNSLYLVNFSDVSSYCQKLKELKDQLANVDQVISEQKLVLRLCAGCVDSDFDQVASMISQTDPLPDFETARSRLLLEESRRAAKEHSSPHAMLGQSSSSTVAPPSPPPAQPTQPTNYNNNRGRGRGGGRGSRNYRGRGRGGSNRGNYSGNNNHRTQNNQVGSNSQSQKLAHLPQPYHVGFNSP